LRTASVTLTVVYFPTEKSKNQMFFS